MCRLKALDTKPSFCCDDTDMALSLNMIFFTLVCFTLCSFRRSNAFDSSSGSSGSSGKLEDEYCGKERFYCPHDSTCYDRELRCTSAKVCVRDANSPEEKCYESETPGRYNFFRKEAPIIFNWSKINHWFVEYRGFVYEFGSGGDQELDVNDPNYKYGPGREKVVKEELKGSSSCTREQVTSFIKKWKIDHPDYKLAANNCQDFSQALIEELKNNCSKRKKRQTSESSNYQCVFTSSAPSHIFLSNWKSVVLYGLLILTSIVFTVN